MTKDKGNGKSKDPLVTNCLSEVEESFFSNLLLVSYIILLENCNIFRDAFQIQIW